MQLLRFHLLLMLYSMISIVTAVNKAHKSRISPPPPPSTPVVAPPLLQVDPLDSFHDAFKLSKAKQWKSYWKEYQTGDVINALGLIGVKSNDLSYLENN